MKVMATLCYCSIFQLLASLRGKRESIDGILQYTLSSSLFVENSTQLEQTREI